MVPPAASIASRAPFVTFKPFSLIAFSSLPDNIILTLFVLFGIKLRLENVKIGLDLFCLF